MKKEIEDKNPAAKEQARKWKLIKLYKEAGFSVPERLREENKNPSGEFKNY